MFKISLNTLPSLLKFATVRAAETGQEVDYLVNSIIDGIGRQSPLILDNLGLSAIDVRTEFKKTGDMATAVANIIERDMANSVTSIDDATNSVQRLNAKFDNFKEAAGTVVVKKLDEISTILAADISWTDRFTASLNYLGQANPSLAILRLIGDNEKLAKTIIETEAALAKYNKEIQNTLIVTGDTETKIQQLVQILTMLDNLVLSNAEAFGFAALAVQYYEKQLNDLLNQAPVELTETLKGLNEELSALKEQFENTDINSPLFRTLQQEIKDLEARIESIVNPTNKGSIAALEAEISRLSEKQKQLNTTTEASIEKYAQLQTKINELQRNISELKRLGDPLEKFNIEAIGKDIEISNNQLKQLEYIMEGIADKTLTATDMWKKFNQEVKNLKKSSGDAGIGNLLTEDTIARQKEFADTLISSIGSVFSDAIALFSTISSIQDDEINRQLEAERGRAQEHFDIMKGIWQQQLERGQITKEELFNQETAYNEKINALEAQQAEIRRQQLRKQAIAEKASASFQLIAGTATAVAKNLDKPPVIAIYLSISCCAISNTSSHTNTRICKRCCRLTR
jgi:predicted transcriptional regulator